MSLDNIPAPFPQPLQKYSYEWASRTIQELDLYFQALRDNPDLSEFLVKPAGSSTYRTLSEIAATSTIVAQSGEAVSHTGDTVETTLRAVEGGAGLLGSNGSLLIHSIWSCTNSDFEKRFLTRFGAVGDAASHAGTAYGDVIFSTIAAYSEIKRIANRNNTAIQIGTVLDRSGGMGQSGVAPPNSTVDTEEPWEIEFSVQLEDAGETATLEAYLIELVQS